MAPKPIRPQDMIEQAAKAFEGYVRFRRNLRSAFIQMVHAWTIALRNAVEPRDQQWQEREQEWETIKTQIGPEGEQIYALCLGKITLACQADYGDWLGNLYQRLSANLTGMGQHFTPFEISRLGAALTMDQNSVEGHIAEQGYVTAHEPTCGSGGMVIAAAMRMRELGFNPATQFRAFAGDLDRTCVEMTYVQCRLMGIACWVQHVNSLDPSSGDEFNYRLATPEFVGQIQAELMAASPESKAA